jgi:hypothetical protein
MPYTIQTGSTAPTIDYGWRFTNDIGALLAENLTAVEGIEKKGSALSIPTDMTIRKKEVTIPLDGDSGEILNYSLYVGIVRGRIKFISYESDSNLKPNPQLILEIRRHVKGLEARLIAEGELNEDSDKSLMIYMGHTSQNFVGN